MLPGSCRFTHQLTCLPTHVDQLPDQPIPLEFAQPSCRCTREFRQVCAIDGTTYNNPCLADCALALIAYPAPCREECAECPTTWKPTCSAESSEKALDGTNYGSRCYAECNGVSADSLFEGNCKLVAGCACTMEWAPVCGADKNTHPSRSCASCAEVPIVSEGECPQCKCTKELSPVCSEEGKEYPNQCLADCEDATIDFSGPCAERSSGGLKSLEPLQPLCRCTRELRPVCSDEGKEYSNQCLADCEGATIDFKGRCADRPVPKVETTFIKIKAFERDNCGCDDGSRQGPPGLLVCGTNGRTYPNECMAKCRGTEVASPGACGDGSEKCDSCPSVSKFSWDPICVTRVVEGPNGPQNASPKTFSSPCLAQCDGGATNNPFYQGECRPRCDSQCYKHKTEPVCCGTGQEFPNTCWAYCVGGFEGDQCTPGQCTGNKGVAVMNKCLQGSPIAMCARNPCAGISCPENANAICISSYCQKYFRYDFIRQLCAPVWYDPVSGELAKECTSKQNEQCTLMGRRCVMDGVVVPPELGEDPCCKGTFCYNNDPLSMFGDCISDEFNH
eukprot:gene26375-17469_t